MWRPQIETLKCRLIIVFIDESGRIERRAINQYPCSFRDVFIKAHHPMRSSHAQASMRQVPPDWRPHCFTSATSLLAAAFSACTEVVAGPAVTRVSVSGRFTGSALASTSLRLCGSTGPCALILLPLPGPPPEFILTSGPEMVTPLGSTFTKLPPALRVTSAPASITIFMPAL